VPIENCLYALVDKGVYTLEDSIKRISEKLSSTSASKEAFLILDILIKADLQPTTSSTTRACEDKAICKAGMLSYDAKVEFSKVLEYFENKVEKIDVIQEFANFQTLDPTSWINKGTYGGDKINAKITVKWKKELDNIDSLYTVTYNDKIYKIMECLNINERNQYLVFYLSLKNTQDGEFEV
jgi:hypothetical protein